jgi:hypothetical protein
MTSYLFNLRNRFSRNKNHLSDLSNFASSIKQPCMRSPHMGSPGSHFSSKQTSSTRSLDNLPSSPIHRAPRSRQCKRRVARAESPPRANVEKEWETALSETCIFLECLVNVLSVTGQLHAHLLQARALPHSTICIATCRATQSQRQHSLIRPSSTLTRSSCLTWSFPALLGSSHIPE